MLDTQAEGEGKKSDEHWENLVRRYRICLTMLDMLYLFAMVACQEPVRHHLSFCRMFRCRMCRSAPLWALLTRATFPPSRALLIYAPRHCLISSPPTMRGNEDTKMLPLTRTEILRLPAIPIKCIRVPVLTDISSIMQTFSL